MTSCPRLGRLFGGCRFRPRYDEVSATGPDDGVAFWAVVGGQQIGQVKPTPARKTYLGDVCETCGDMRFRRRAPAASPAERHGQVPGKDQ